MFQTGPDCCSERGESSLGVTSEIECPAFEPACARAIFRRQFVDNRASEGREIERWCFLVEMMAEQCATHGGVIECDRERDRRGPSLAREAQAGPRCPTSPPGSSRSRTQPSRPARLRGDGVTPPDCVGTNGAAPRDRRRRATPHSGRGPIPPPRSARSTGGIGWAANTSRFATSDSHSSSSTFICVRSTGSSANRSRNSSNTACCSKRRAHRGDHLGRDLRFPRRREVQRRAVNTYLDVAAGVGVEPSRRTDEHLVASRSSSTSSTCTRRHPR